MKRLTLHRLASALLCLTLALSLTACGGKKKPAPAAGNGGVKGPVSSSKTDQTGQADPVKPSEPEAEVDQELVKENVSTSWALIWNTAAIPAPRPISATGRKGTPPSCRTGCWKTALT